MSPGGAAFRRPGPGLPCVIRAVSAEYFPAWFSAAASCGDQFRLLHNGLGSFWALRLSPTVPGFPIPMDQLLASNTTTTRGRALTSCRVAIGRAALARGLGTIHHCTGQPRCPSRAVPATVPESVIAFARELGAPAGDRGLSAAGGACCGAVLLDGEGRAGYLPGRLRDGGMPSGTGRAQSCLLQLSAPRRAAGAGGAGGSRRAAPWGGGWRAGAGWGSCRVAVGLGVLWWLPAGLSRWPCGDALRCSGTRIGAGWGHGRVALDLGGLRRSSAPLGGPPARRVAGCCGRVLAAAWAGLGRPVPHPVSVGARP